MVEDALGVVHLQFDGWAQRDETARFLWDLPFYEPWFLVLGVLVTLGAVPLIAAPAARLAPSGGSWS